jgi:RES domain-containing protein
LHPRADTDLVSAITGTFTPELAKKISVTPAERAAREAERIRLATQLQQTADMLGEFDHLLGDNTSSSSAYISGDIDNLTKWQTLIEQHLSTADLYKDALSVDAVRKLPQLSIDQVWYRLGRSQQNPKGDFFTPARIPTRFNPGQFETLSMAEDALTAAFEITKNADLSNTVELLKRLTLMQFSVRLDQVADLSSPASVKQALGIDFSSLIGLGNPNRVSVTQQICLNLFLSGFQGAIFPSRTTIGKKNLVLFPSSLRAKNPVSLLFSGSLKTP